MEFTCHTVYNRKALTAMARAVRKTIRAKRSRLVRLYAWLLVAVLLLSLWISWGEVWKNVLDGVVLAVLLLIQWKEDALNGCIAKRHALPGTSFADTAFHADHYLVRTDAAESKWQYDRILALAETRDYLVFVMGKNHALAMEKAALEGGSLTEFRRFLEEKTGQTVRNVGG